MTQRKHRGPNGAGSSGGAPPRRPRGRRADPNALLHTIDQALAAEHPLSLLGLASSLINSTLRGDSSLPDGASAAALPPLPQLLAMFAADGSIQTRSLAWAMAQLIADDLTRARVTRSVDVSLLPEWLAQLDRVSVHAAVQTTDRLLDGSNIAFGVQVAGHEMTVVGFVDFNNGAALKDGFAIEESLASFIDYWQELDSHGATELTRISLADARAKIAESVRFGDQIWPPFTSETWPDLHPLLEWVLRHCPGGGTGWVRPSWSDADRAAMIKDFHASPHGQSFVRDPDCRELLDLVLTYGIDSGYGDPLLLSATKVELLLLDWVPRNVSGHADFLIKLPALLAGFVPFGHERRGIPAEDTINTLQAVATFAAPYLKLINTGSPELADSLDGWEATRSHLLELMALSVGGPEILDALDVSPLPDEELQIDDVAEDIRGRVRTIAALIDRCCSTLFDTEHRTAVRRLLHDVAVRGPDVFRRRSKDETAAAALCWLIARANGSLTGESGVYAKDLLAHFGLTGSVSQRAMTMRQAADLPTDHWRSDLGSTRYLVSHCRRELISRRDYWRTIDDYA